MRIALLIVLALAGCAKKTAAPKSPTTPAAAPDTGSAATPTESPAPAAGNAAPDSTPAPKSDPEEGGQ